MSDDVIFGVSDFVGSLNQTLDFAYPSVTIIGELANLRVSKGKWVYFDLKDEQASIRFFGTVYNLPGPLEDGLMLQVRGAPRLHPAFGFSVTVQYMQPVGKGSLKKAANLLEAKLRAEGLFDPIRKRPLPYPPKRIALITSLQSAAYADFIKVLNERWSGVHVDAYDVQVQGEIAASQVIQAIEQANADSQLPDVLVVTRGGGSADDLAVFNTEQVTRAVATSRIPTLVAIGHEVDISLAELAADQRASTPSNAAQLLTPDKTHEQNRLASQRGLAAQALVGYLRNKQNEVESAAQQCKLAMAKYIETQLLQLQSQKQLLAALSPQAALQRGYAIIRDAQSRLIMRSAKALHTGQKIDIQLNDAHIHAKVISVKALKG